MDTDGNTSPVLSSLFTYTAASVFSVQYISWTWDCNITVPLDFPLVSVVFFHFYRASLIKNMYACVRIYIIHVWYGLVGKTFSFSMSIPSSSFLSFLSFSCMSLFHTFLRSIYAYAYAYTYLIVNIIVPYDIMEK